MAKEPQNYLNYLTANSSFQICCKSLQLVTTNIHHFLYLKKLGCCLLVLEMWGGQVKGGNYAERSLTQTDGARKKLYSKKYKSKPFSILCVAKISFYKEKWLIRILILIRNLLRPPTTLLKLVIFEWYCTLLHKMALSINIRFKYMCNWLHITSEWSSSQSKNQEAIWREVPWEWQCFMYLWNFSIRRSSQTWSSLSLLS